MMSADVVSSMDDTEPRAYRLVRPLGRGGSSWVWEAEPVGDAAKRVVVKRLDAGDHAIARMYRAELSALRAAREGAQRRRR